MAVTPNYRQLRPKVNNFYLTVEKGEGFDLNRSLFERLVLKDYPHAQLEAQHRMRPEISALVRHLTYPYLQDAPKTQGRPNIRGIRSNVVFINHEQPEDEVEAEERRDMKSSKQNRCALIGIPPNLLYRPNIQVRSGDGSQDRPVPRPTRLWY